METFFGEEVIIEEQKVQITGINEITTTNDDKPIIATRDIKSCIAILIICEDEARITHIETEKNCRLIGLETIKKILKDIKSPIKAELVFYGEKTPAKYKSECELTPEEKDELVTEEKDVLAEILNTFDKYPAYLDNDNGSIAYDFSTNQYYGIDNDGIFYEYKLGAINKKIDPIEAYYSNGHSK